PGRRGFETAVNDRSPEEDVARGAFTSTLRQFWRRSNLCNTITNAALHPTKIVIFAWLNLSTRNMRVAGMKAPRKAGFWLDHNEGRDPSVVSPEMLFNGRAARNGRARPQLQRGTP